MVATTIAPHRRLLPWASFIAFLCVAGSSDAFVPASSTTISRAASTRVIHREPSSHRQHQNIIVAASSRFAPSPRLTRSSSRPRATTTLVRGGAASIDDLSDDAKWIPLVEADDGNSQPAPVRKCILEEGDGGDLPQKGATAELEYAGTLLGESDWSADDVVACWLSNLQGLDHLIPAFIENAIDGGKLLDDAFFTEEYCTGEMGVSNKIQAKKLVMASKRLTKQQGEYPRGTQFDSSISRGKNYSFVTGRGKAIKAMELAVGSMRVGERAMLVCRADYGYGPEGLRTSKGNVMVPPFATLCFELKLVSAT